MAVKVRERPPGSGKWWVFVDYQGKRCAHLIPQGKRAAERAAAVLNEKLGLLRAANEQGIPLSVWSLATNGHAPEPALSGPTLKEYSKTFLEGCEARGLKYTTRRSYDGVLNTHLLPAFGTTPLGHIDRRAVKALALAKRTGGASANTVRIMLCTLSALFSSAIEDGIVQQNPALRPGRFMKMRDRKSEVTPLTHEEEVAFLEAVKKHALPYYPLFLLLLRTGCRIGEAVALQPGDLDFRGRFIEIRRNWTNGRMTTPKNHRSRRVDMSKGLADALRAHLATQELEAVTKNTTRPEWVFCNEHGRILDPDNLRHRVFYRVLEKAALRRIRIHDLRHTFCSRLIANGESLAYVRDQAGHSSIQVTVDIYGHLVPGSNKQAVDRLDEPVDKSTTGAEDATIRNQPLQIIPQENSSVLKPLILLEPAVGIEPTTC